MDLWDSVSGYIRLARLKHGLKNVVIFVPVICSGQLFDKDAVIMASVAFLRSGLLRAGCML